MKHIFETENRNVSKLNWVFQKQLFFIHSKVLCLYLEYCQHCEGCMSPIAEIYLKHCKFSLNIFPCSILVAGAPEVHIWTYRKAFAYMVMHFRYQRRI